MPFDSQNAIWTINVVTGANPIAWQEPEGCGFFSIGLAAWRHIEKKISHPFGYRGVLLGKGDAEQFRAADEVLQPDRLVTLKVRPLNDAFNREPADLSDRRFMLQGFAPPVADAQLKTYLARLINTTHYVAPVLGEFCYDRSQGVFSKAVLWLGRPVILAFPDAAMDCPGGCDVPIATLLQLTNDAPLWDKLVRTFATQQLIAESTEELSTSEKKLFEHLVSQIPMTRIKADQDGTFEISFTNNHAFHLKHFCVKGSIKEGITILHFV